GKYYGDSDESACGKLRCAPLRSRWARGGHGEQLFPGGVGEHRLRDQGDDDNFGMDFSGVEGGAAVCCVSGCGGLRYWGLSDCHRFSGGLWSGVHQRNAVGGEIADTASSAGDWSTAER